MKSSFKVFDTLSRKLRIFKPVLILKEGQKPLIRLYTCGPTVYNVAHIGNFRAYLFEDLLRRYLKFKGFEVRQVMNITDIDDKTIRDSRKEGISLGAFTKKYTDAFFEDLSSLNIEPAELYPRATEHIPEMILLIKHLLENGLAYKTDDHCVWFSISKFKGYGKLAHINVKGLKVGASGRVLADEYEKEEAADFSLWKAWDKEDGDVYWPSPFGKGRPGWHIECSAMSMKHLTNSFSNGAFNPTGFQTIDIHTGGVDNIFPHHEDEIAQSQGVVRKPFVKYWMHCEHLLVDGKKMSKSLGNFFTLRDLKAKGCDLRAFRYLILSVHYRQKLNFTFDSLAGAREAVKAMDDFILNLGRAKSPVDCKELPVLLHDLEVDFTKSMDNDLNVSLALSSIFSCMRKLNKIHENLSRADAHKVGTLFKRLDRVLGVMKFNQEEAPKEILELVSQREQARGKKDWKRADDFRKKILGMGWLVEDLPEGPRVKRVG